MNYEIEIRLTENRIDEIETKLREIKKSLKDLESAKRDAENDTTLGLLQMSSSALRPIGTYNFLNGAGTVGDIRIKIKELEQDKKDLEWELFEEKNKLKHLNEEFEYSKRDQANLVTTKEGIFIEGDESNRNVISWLEHKVNSYIAEYNRILESEEVADYKRYKAEFEKLVKETVLPEATPENLEELKIMKQKYGSSFKYIVMDGKIIVEDCFTDAIETSNKLVSYYTQDVEKARKKYDEFQPTFFGKVFKKVGKKQKEKWDSEVKDTETHYISYLEEQKKKTAEYEAAKAKYIDPAVEVLASLERLNKHIDDSYYVQKFINEIDEYKKNIENHTILKNIDDSDVMFSILSSFRYYLDQHGLKLTREDIYDAIFESEYHQDLAQEIYNARGYKPRKKKVQVVASEPASE